MISRDFKKTAKPKRPPPLSIRVSEEEEARLKVMAGRRSINAFVKSRLFGETKESRKRERRRPDKYQKELAQALSMLGQSRLASNLNQIAKLANQGALPLDDDLATELQKACDDIRIMRTTLLKALERGQ